MDQRGAPRGWDEPSVPNAYDAGDIGAAEFIPAATVPAAEATEVEAPAGAVAPAGSLYDRGCEVDPTHARLHPSPSSGGPFRLLLTTRTPVGTFVVEASADLTDWVPIGTVVVDGYLGLFEDSGANSPRRFYRAVLHAVTHPLLSAACACSSSYRGVSISTPKDEDDDEDELPGCSRKPRGLRCWR